MGLRYPDKCEWFNRFGFPVSIFTEKVLNRSKCVNRIIDLNHIKNYLQHGRADDFMDVRIRKLGVNAGNIDKRIEATREKLNEDDRN